MARSDTDNIWFYDVRADGFSLDDKRNPVGLRRTLRFPSRATAGPHMLTIGTTSPAMPSLDANLLLR